MDQGGAVRTGTRRGSNPLEAIRTVPTRLDASRNGHCQGGKHDVNAGGDSPSIPNVAATIARGLGPVKSQTKKIGANRPRCVEIFCLETSYVDFFVQAASSASVVTHGRAGSLLSIVPLPIVRPISRTVIV